MVKRLKNWWEVIISSTAFRGGTVVKNLPTKAGRHKRCSFYPWVRKISWNRKWQPIPVFLPGKSHGWRSLAGYSPWGHKELDTTEQLKNSKKRWSLPEGGEGWNSRRVIRRHKLLGKDKQPGMLRCCGSVTKSCLTLCDAMNCSTPGFPVLHCLPEFAQTHVLWANDAFSLKYLL